MLGENLIHSPWWTLGLRGTSNDITPHLGISWGGRSALDLVANRAAGPPPGSPNSTAATARVRDFDQVMNSSSGSPGAEPAAEIKPLAAEAAAAAEAAMYVGLFANSGVSVALGQTVAYDEQHGQRGWFSLRCTRSRSAQATAPGRRRARIAAPARFTAPGAMSAWRAKCEE